MEKGVSIKDSTNNLLETEILREVSRRNGEQFAMELALWLVRYIIVISSINESLEINLEMILSRLHGEDNFKKILKLTEEIFDRVHNRSINELFKK
jgi:polyhydroxyalkanoate synthesis regulator protein